VSDLTSPATAHFDATTMMRYDANKRSTGIAYLLWFFLGGLGVHRFYLRRTGTGVAMLCLSIAAVVFYMIGIGVAAGAGDPDNASQAAAGAVSVLAILGFIAGAVVTVWWIVDAFLIPGMARAYNNGLIAQLSGPGAGVALR
jgi:TM2 domain-containing membrane protein YozV